MKKIAKRVSVTNIINQIKTATRSREFSCLRMNFRTIKKVIIDNIIHDMGLTNQLRMINPICSQLIKSLPVAIPAPNNVPIAVWVVEIGIPYALFKISQKAAEINAQTLANA